MIMSSAYSTASNLVNTSLNSKKKKKKTEVREFKEKPTLSRIDKKLMNFNPRSEYFDNLNSKVQAKSLSKSPQKIAFDEGKLNWYKKKSIQDQVKISKMKVIAEQRDLSNNKNELHSA